MIVEFYKGPPFGYIFDRENPEQFQVPPIQSPNPIAKALQGASSIWDQTTHTYVAITHDPHDTEYNVGASYEDYVSMRLWLQGATQPLDIV